MALRNSADAFLDFIDQWFSDLPVVHFKSLLRDIPPERTALISVDVVNGFCKSGKLASPRVAQIVRPVTELFRKAEQNGIQHYALSEDHHPEHSEEFTIYPEHCIVDTEEAKTVQELRDLPHAYKFNVIPKKTINPGIEHGLREWLDLNDQLRQFIVVGDCTDICVYLLSIYIKSRSVERDEHAEVLVPSDCVDTFDIPVETYKLGGPLPHPAEILHCLFLYHLQLNGIRIVAGIE